MAYNFLNFKQKIGDVENWLSDEFKTIRTGRATPSILDSVMVESYGAKMPIKQVASVTTEDARTLRVSPWDASQMKALEKAIIDADLGLSVVVDSNGMRVIFPELTSDRREALNKVAREKAEKAKISIRGERDEIWSDIQEKQKGGEISEDEKYKLKDEMQKIVDEANKKIEEMVERKENEIKS